MSITTIEEEIIDFQSNPKHMQEVANKVHNFKIYCEAKINELYKFITKQPVKIEVTVNRTKTVSTKGSVKIRQMIIIFRLVLTLCTQII